MHNFVFWPGLLLKMALGSQHLIETAKNNEPFSRLKTSLDEMHFLVVDHLIIRDGKKKHAIKVKNILISIARVAGKKLVKLQFNSNPNKIKKYSARAGESVPSNVTFQKCIYINQAKFPPFSETCYQLLFNLESGFQIKITVIFSCPLLWKNVLSKPNTALVQKSLLSRRCYQLPSTLFSMLPISCRNVGS